MKIDRNRSYDALSTEYDFKDYAFSKLRERYMAWTGNSMEDKLFDSFEIRDKHDKLTNAGALMADDSPVRHSRLFCTRWNGFELWRRNRRGKPCVWGCEWEWRAVNSNTKTMQTGKRPSALLNCIDLH